MWNLGDSDHHVTVVVDMNDVSGEPQIVLRPSNLDADAGYFMYDEFDTAETGVSVKLRAFYASFSENDNAWAHFPVGAMWDNIAITPLAHFQPPVFDLSGETLIPAGSFWRYLDDGTDQGTSWRARFFDDDLWDDGHGQLGYGDDDETTVVNCGSSAPACGSDNFATTYFRHTFVVDNASLVESLSGLILRDDAAAVYLNGSEVFRDGNLPSGAAYNTFATSIGVENGETVFTIDPSLLSDGANVLAVEVHQASSTSGDVSFDLQINAVIRPIPEPTTLTLTALGLIGCAARWRRRRR